MRQVIGLYSVGTFGLPGLGVVVLVTFAEIARGSPDHLSWVLGGALAQNWCSVPSSFFHLINADPDLSPHRLPNRPPDPGT